MSDMLCKSGELGEATPSFAEYARQWFEVNGPRLKPSYCYALRTRAQKHLIPYWGTTEVGKMSKDDVYAFRAHLDEVVVGCRKGLCAGTKNGIMLSLKLIMADAAARFEFNSPCEDVKQATVARPAVDPFTLKEVQIFLNECRTDYRNYYLVRFLTGMKDGEINGLKWECLDFENRLISVRETLVAGVLNREKGRDIHMGAAVAKALLDQRETRRGKSEFVFCTTSGTPLRSTSVTTSVWYPDLERMKLRKRHPHQTRHTAAVLYLAAGEKPEWIAGQLGHPTVRAFIDTYWEFIPKVEDPLNGSAFDRLISDTLKL